jgi:hypothetical protein
MNFCNSPLHFSICSTFIFCGNIFHFATKLLLWQVDYSLSRIIPISSISLAIGLLILIVDLPLAPTILLFLFNKFNSLNDTSLYVNMSTLFGLTCTSLPLAISIDLSASFIKSIWCVNYNNPSLFNPISWGINLADFKSKGTSIHISNNMFSTYCIQVTHSQLLKRFKSESKYKTTKGAGVEARSLAYNTLKGRGACWSSRMGLERVDKLHSLTRACTQPTQGG